MNLSNPSLGFYRTALNFGLDCNKVLLQGAQRVRRYQIEQIDAALADYNGLSKKLQKSPTQEQLMALGSDLAGNQLVGAVVMNPPQSMRRPGDGRYASKNQPSNHNQLVARTAN